jgi:hypothetical protein
VHKLLLTPPQAAKISGALARDLTSDTDGIAETIGEHISSSDKYESLQPLSLEREAPGASRAPTRRAPLVMARVRSPLLHQLRADLEVLSRQDALDGRARAPPKPLQPA